MARYSLPKIAKIAIIIYIAAWLSSKGKDLQNVSYGVAPFAVLLGLIVGLIVVQPDISTSSADHDHGHCHVLHCRGRPRADGDSQPVGRANIWRRHHSIGSRARPHRCFHRLLRHPFKRPNFQVREAISALVEGGVFGQGLAESIHKRTGGLPAVHSDSIFAIVGEELGLIGALLILALFFFFAYRGIRIALRAPDQFRHAPGFWHHHLAGATSLHQHRRHHRHLPLHRPAATLFQLRRFQHCGQPRRHWHLAEHLRGGGAVSNFNAIPRLWRRNRRSRVSDPDRRRGAVQRSPSYARTANQPRRKSSKRGHAIEIRYAGTPMASKRSWPPTLAFHFTPIAAGQLRIRNPIKLVRNSLRLVGGSLQARKLIATWRPDALFVTGGYVCAPVVWAARRQDVPILIYLPDVTPGLAVQRLAQYADKVAVTFPEVADYFPHKAIVTGYPVRPELTDQGESKAEARIQFQLQPALPTLLIFGGSRGARSINIALAAILPSF